MATPTEQILHIATAVDEAYLTPLRVMLASLMENLRPSFRPVLYLLNRNLNSRQLKSIAGLVETHSVVPTGEAIQGLPRQRGFPLEAAYPLLLADILPETLERVLFLDPDLLILDDVAKIWETDLKGRIIAAVADQAIPLCSSPRGVKDRRDLGVPETAPYFNAGAMLIDIARWRMNEVTARACEYLEQRNGRTDFFHQEALNAVLWNHWIPLDQRWNLIASLAGRRYGPYKSARCASPGIVHFAGRFKPWRFRIGGPFADSYDEFIARCSNGDTSGRTSLSERLLSFYDRHARDYLYPCERALWNNRLI